MVAIIPEHSGFCPGVKNAEKHIFKTRRASPEIPLTVYGYLINNRKYIGYLSEHGVSTVDSMESIPHGATVVIRTHGIDRRDEDLLRKKFDVLDLTCVHVKRVQHEIRRHADAGYHVIILGKKKHPETHGLVSYALEYTVIESAGDIDALFNDTSVMEGIIKSGKLFVCSQTTGSCEFFDETLSSLRIRFSDGVDIAVYDSICPVTDKKEKEALRLQKQVDITIVVGDAISSNAKKLYTILSADGHENVYFIQDLAELLTLRLPLERYGTALVVSSASTPGFVEKEIRDYLEAVVPIKDIPVTKGLLG